MVAYSFGLVGQLGKNVGYFLPKYAAFFIRLSTTFGYSSSNRDAVAVLGAFKRIASINSQATYAYEFRSSGFFGWGILRNHNDY